MPRRWRATCWADDEPTTSLRGACSVAKKATWSEPIPLEEVKALGKAMGGTVNDVMLAAIAGGLRRYLMGQRRGYRFPGPAGGCSVQYALDPIGPGQLGNQLGMVLMALPVGLEEAGDRFDAVKKRMDELKEFARSVHDLRAAELGCIQHPAELRISSWISSDPKPACW